MSIEAFPLWVVFSFAAGLALGSFANVLIFRLPQGLSIIKPSSCCPACGSPIAPYDNIPILSYLILKGRCRKCGGRISIRYPVVELSTGLLFTALMLKSGPSWSFLFYAGFGLILLIHAMIDFKHYLLLDAINLSGAVFGVSLLLISPDLSLRTGLWGALVGGGTLLLIYTISIVMFKKEGMGLGDIKMGVVCGLFLGPIHTGLMLLTASVFGLIWGIIRLIFKGERMLPFGTLMAAASILVIFLGDFLLEWYFSFLP